jgi:hypothetical protein
MFILDPDPYLTPSYRISPFRTSDISFNIMLPEDNFVDEYFRERFYRNSFKYTINGREALNIALRYYNLDRKDIVTILTTSGNFYISGCVTKEIEKFCCWSREIEDGTRVILVNHEFGYPYNSLIELKKYGIPIIEDCAHSFFSGDKENTIGNIGDFIIYSFPKMFPVQIGGLVVSKMEFDDQCPDILPEKERQYIKNVLSYHLNIKDEIVNKRINNYGFLSEALSKIGLIERFNTPSGIIPGVFMFKTDSQKLDLPELKKYLYSHGVQCSVFYGEESFYIPVHQALNEMDMLFFCEVIRSFIHKSVT